jgi:hypothetical protein
VFEDEWAVLVLVAAGADLVGVAGAQLPDRE